MRGYVLDLRGLSDVQASAVKSELSANPCLCIAFAHDCQTLYLLTEPLCELLVQLRETGSFHEYFADVLSELSKAGDPFDSRADYQWRGRITRLILE